MFPADRLCRNYLLPTTLQKAVLCLLCDFYLLIKDCIYTHNLVRRYWLPYPGVMRCLRCQSVRNSDYFHFGLRPDTRVRQCVVCRATENAVTVSEVYRRVNYYTVPFQGAYDLYMFCRDPGWATRDAAERGRAPPEPPALRRIQRAGAAVLGAPIEYATVLPIVSRPYHDTPYRTVAVPATPAVPRRRNGTLPAPATEPRHSVTIPQVVSDNSNDDDVFETRTSPARRRLFPDARPPGGTPAGAGAPPCAPPASPLGKRPRSPGAAQRGRPLQRNTSTRPVAAALCILCKKRLWTTEADSGCCDRCRTLAAGGVLCEVCSDRPRRQPFDPDDGADACCDERLAERFRKCATCGRYRVRRPGDTEALCEGCLAAANALHGTDDELSDYVDIETVVDLRTGKPWPENPTARGSARLRTPSTTIDLTESAEGGGEAGDAGGQTPRPWGSEAIQVPTTPGTERPSAGLPRAVRQPPPAEDSSLPCSVTATPGTDGPRVSPFAPFTPRTPAHAVAPQKPGSGRSSPLSSTSESSAV